MLNVFPSKFGQEARGPSLAKTKFDFSIPADHFLGHVFVAISICNFDRIPDQIRKLTDQVRWLPDQASELSACVHELPAPRLFWPPLRGENEIGLAGGSMNSSEYVRVPRRARRSRRPSGGTTLTTYFVFEIGSALEGRFEPLVCSPRLAKALTSRAW